MFAIKPMSLHAVLQLRRECDAYDWRGAAARSLAGQHSSACLQSKKAAIYRSPAACWLHAQCSCYDAALPPCCQRLRQPLKITPCCRSHLRRASIRGHPAVRAATRAADSDAADCSKQWADAAAAGWGGSRSSSSRCQGSCSGGGAAAVGRSCGHSIISKQQAATTGVKPWGPGSVHTARRHTGAGQGGYCGD